jgi:aspartyl-tRNA(Asn)/glutamyl-tRNA(Gln) amidotransferase subunit A
MASTVADAAALLEAIAGHDPRDATTVMVTGDGRDHVPDYAGHLLEKGEGSVARGAGGRGTGESRPLAGVKLGLIRETLGAGCDAAVEGAVRGAAARLEALGAAVEEVSWCGEQHVRCVKTVS